MLLVIPLNPKKRGSLEDQLAALGRALRLRGTSATLVGWREPSKAAATLFAEAGLDVRVIDFSDERTAAAKLAWLAWTERVRVAHLHLLRAASPIVVALAATGARVILNEHLPLNDIHRGM